MEITIDFINQNYNEIKFYNLKNLNFETLKYVFEICKLNDNRSNIYCKDYLVTVNGKSKKFNDTISFPELVYNNRKNIDWDYDKALEIENLINEKDIDYKNKTSSHRYPWNFLLGTEILNNKYFLVDNYDKIHLSEVMIENPDIFWDYHLFGFFIKQLNINEVTNYFESSILRTKKSHFYDTLMNLGKIKTNCENLIYHSDFFDKKVIFYYEKYKRSDGYEPCSDEYRIWDFVYFNKNIEWNKFLSDFAAKDRGMDVEKQKSYNLGYKEGYRMCEIDRMLGIKKNN